MKNQDVFDALHEACYKDSNQKLPKKRQKVTYDFILDRFELRKTSNSKFDNFA